MCNPTSTGRQGSPKSTPAKDLFETPASRHRARVATTHDPQRLSSTRILMLMVRRFYCFTLPGNCVWIAPVALAAKSSAEMQKKGALGGSSGDRGSLEDAGDEALDIVGEGFRASHKLCSISCGALISFGWRCFGHLTALRPRRLDCPLTYMVTIPPAAPPCPDNQSLSIGLPPRPVSRGLGHAFASASRLRKAAP
jgi:hypothetical protein